jgi:hypothetical protein
MEIPQQFRNSPQAYAMYLRGQGVPPMQIAQMVMQQFGSPQDYQQQQLKGQAKEEQKGNIAGALGTLVGSVGASQLPKLFGGAGAGAGAGATGATAGTVGATTAGTGGGAAILGTPTPWASSVGTTGGTLTGGGTTLGTIGSAALPVAVGAALLSNAYETGGKDILKGKGDSADWTNQGINMLLPGANIAARLIGGKSIGERMKSGKSEAQQIRDDYRGFLKAEGVADDNYNVTLADGSTFDIGKDGKAKLTNADGKTNRRYYEIDWDNPLAQKAVEMIDPKVRENFGDAKQAEQLTAMLVNAATSNAKTPEEVQANINAMMKESKLAGGTMNPATLPVDATTRIRPKKGETIRVSAGVYRGDTGKLKKASSMKEALGKFYKKDKEG